MRLATVATATGPRVCVVQGGEFFPLGPETLSMRELLGRGPAGIRALASEVGKAGPALDPTQVRLLPPVPDPSKILCIGLNYRDHAAESGMPPPSEPVLFAKYPNTLIGHEAAIVLPAASHEVDYEAELVVVIGKQGKHIPRDRAFDHVGGYTVGHDVSARDWQLNKPGKQWTAGKTFDTFAPTGPAIVTPDEIPDPHQLGIRLRLNGQTMQDSSTSQLIFRVDELIAYLSGVMTLEPGDLIFTGTPPGVGMARKPPVWLKPKDIVEVEIDGLGVLRNPVAAETPDSKPTSPR